ncbi:MAG: hypothetical protein WKF94_04520 [Solirubrobacteraceae bacterium]
MLEEQGKEEHRSPERPMAVVKHPTTTQTARRRGDIWTLPRVGGGKTDDHDHDHDLERDALRRRETRSADEGSTRLRG